MEEIFNMFKSKSILIVGITITLILGVFSFGSTTPTVSSLAYDVIIEKGRIIDGTGGPWYYGDVGIQSGEIVTIGNLEEATAARRIDATDMFVTPGFIDMHTHSDGRILREPWGPLAENSVRQGLTTIVGGSCGGSKFPMDEHLAEVERANPSINYVTWIGHSTIRRQVVGDEDRAPTPDELDQMKALVAQSMEAGAFGLSTNLNTTPGFYAETEEIIELCKVVAEYGGIYCSHMRDESAFTVGLIAAVEEAIRIGEESGVSVQISHMKCLGTPVWKLSDEVLNLIQQARKRGVSVIYDQYPYTASSTSLASMYIPRWARDGGTEELLRRLEDPKTRALIREEMLKNLAIRGGAENQYVSRHAADNTIENKSFQELAKLWDEEPVDVAIKIQIAGGASMISHNMIDYDLENYLLSPYGTIGSDGSIREYGKAAPHPRNYGTFPRVLGVYVREKGLLTWEEAIRRMTSTSANQLGLFDRGIIREGLVADIVVFDPETVIDTATFQNPHQYPEGIPYVLVNGKIVVDEGEHTGVRSGVVLYGRGRK